jgi:hypothetical protein
MVAPARHEAFAVLDPVPRQAELALQGLRAQRLAGGVLGIEGRGDC